MSDARLRDAEREFAATGSLGDEAAVLRERLRVGLITPKAVDIACNCLGYPAAFLVMGGENDTWEYWRPDRLPDELSGLTVELNGVALPLSVITVAPFAKEMASLLKEVASDRYRMPEMRPYLRLASALPLNRLALTPAQTELAITVMEAADRHGGVDAFDEVQLMYAIIVLASQPPLHVMRDFPLILQLFLRNANIVGHLYSTRHYWARRMILHVLIPHLLGHASTVPHSEHLWQAKRRIPPQHRTPER